MNPPAAAARRRPASGVASFRFYEELNDFLPPAHRRTVFEHTFRGPVTIKDVVESLGVPHPEIDLILVNGQSVRFSYRLRDGDRVSVYPLFEAFDITPLQRLRPRPLRVSRFVLDCHLGALSRYLRLLGFDTLYRNDYDDAELAHVSRHERRILLTRDLGLLKRSLVTRGCFLRETRPLRQLHEVVRRLDLYRQIRPFRRCLRCNGRLLRVRRSALAGAVPARVLDRHDSFRRCRNCRQLYWPGSHFERMRAIVAQVIAAAPVAG